MSDDIYSDLDQLLRDLSEKEKGIEEVDSEQVKYLMNQGYVNKSDSKYSLSLTGRLFVVNGGYRNQRKKEKINRNFQIGFWVSAILNFLLTVVLVTINILDNQDSNVTNNENLFFNFTFETDSCKIDQKKISKGHKKID